MLHRFSKKGDKSNPENYRPISILPTISKLFERHIASQIYDFFLRNDLLHREQSGFRQFHSCQTALKLDLCDKNNLQIN